MMILVVHVTFLCKDVVFARGVLHMMQLLHFANIPPTLFALLNCVKKIISVVYVRRYFIINGGILGGYEKEMMILWL
jgi:hypothetical protein